MNDQNIDGAAEMSTEGRNHVAMEAIDLIEQVTISFQLFFWKAHIND